MGVGEHPPDAQLDIIEDFPFLSDFASLRLCVGFLWASLKARGGETLNNGGTYQHFTTYRVARQERGAVFKGEGLLDFA
ncbi:MAG: hypothetical protein ACLFTI_13130 [Anaerolineales bacterium]